MFGMAMKFLELGLEPIIKANSRENQTTSQNSNETNEKHTKIKAKSTEIINFQGQNGSLTEKVNQNKNNEAGVTLSHLKQSQQKVLEDFKRSIERSIAYSHHNSPDQPKTQKTQLQPYDVVQGIVLSKIQQLSQEYLEYSLRKLPTIYHHNSKSKTASSNLDRPQKNSSSCELIRSIVKSVLLPQSVTLTQTSQKLSLQNVYLKQSSVKKSQNKLQQKSQSLNTGSNNAISSSQIAQPVTEFIKELFESLGLIEKGIQMPCSLKEMTENARKKFNSLKGNDYVEKLNEMLQSVEEIGQTRVLEVRSQIDPHLKNTSSTPITSSQYTQRYEQKQRKEILVKRESEKKVKIISPYTIQDLHSKRNLIEKQLSDAIEFLTISRRLRKFSFGSTSINEVLVNFSFDFQFMSYKRVKPGFFTEANIVSFLKKLCKCIKTSQKQADSQKQEPQASIIPLKWNLVNIAKGLKTKNFIKFEEFLVGSQRQELHEDRCFSLLFKNRTYDFECESKAIRDEYFRAIKILIKNTSDA